MKLLSKYLPPVSHIPRITLVRFWGLMPNWTWDKGFTRRRKIMPAEIGLIRAVAEVVILPIRLVAAIAGQVRAQAEKERHETPGKVTPRPTPLRGTHLESGSGAPKGGSGGIKEAEKTPRGTHGAPIRRMGRHGSGG